jgi:hypothetical protein
MYFKRQRLKFYEELDVKELRAQLYQIFAGMQD